MSNLRKTCDISFPVDTKSRNILWKKWQELKKDKIKKDWMQGNRYIAKYFFDIEVYNLGLREMRKELKEKRKPKILNKLKKQLLGEK